MGLAIAILLTLAMLGSVLWVMPSPREKQLTAMRQKAMSSGMKVRLLNEKMAAKLYPWIDNYRGYVSYELPLPGGSKWQISAPVVIPVDQNALHELDRQGALANRITELGCFEDLPKTAEALVFYSGCVVLLWREDEGLEGVEKVLCTLKKSLELTDREFQS